MRDPFVHPARYSMDLKPRAGQLSVSKRWQCSARGLVAQALCWWSISPLKDFLCRSASCPITVNSEVLQETAASWLPLQPICSQCSRLLKCQGQQVQVFIAFTGYVTPSVFVTSCCLSALPIKKNLTHNNIWSDWPHHYRERKMHILMSRYASQQRALKAPGCANPTISQIKKKEREIHMGF